MEHFIFCKCLTFCSYYKIKGELHLLVKVVSLLVSTAGQREFKTAANENHRI